MFCYLCQHSLTLHLHNVFRVLYVFTAVEISNLTSRFRLGLGVFVDKPTAPYMDTHPMM